MAKLVECIMVDSNGTSIPTSATGQEMAYPIYVYPDENGKLFYWDGPKDVPVQVDVVAEVSSVAPPSTATKVWSYLTTYSGIA